MRPDALLEWENRFITATARFPPGRDVPAALGNDCRRANSLDVFRWIAAQQQTEIDRLNTWDGLMSLLDKYYPADVFDGSSGNVGPRMTNLIRVVDKLRDLLAEWTDRRPLLFKALRRHKADWEDVLGLLERSEVAIQTGEGR